MMTRREALKRGLPVFGIFRSFAAVGVDPAIMGIGPAVAIPAAVQQVGGPAGSPVQGWLTASTLRGPGLLSHQASVLLCCVLGCRWRLGAMLHSNVFLACAGLTGCLACCVQHAVYYYGAGRACVC